MGFDINRPFHGVPVVDDVVRTAGDVVKTQAEVTIAPAVIVVETAQGKPADKAFADVTQQIIDDTKKDARNTGAAFGQMAALENRLTIDAVRTVGGDQAAGITEFLLSGKSIQDQIVAAAPQIVFKDGRPVTAVELAESPLSSTVAGGIQQAINTLQDKATPIPLNIKRSLKGFYPPEVLDEAKFWLGTIAITFPELINGYQSLMGNHAFAVTVGNIIVFSVMPTSDDAGFHWWAHEMQHVLQYHERGVYQFAIDYVRDYPGIEADAEAKAAAVLAG